MQPKPILSIQPFRRLDWLILVVIVLVAAGLRLADGGAGTAFRYDQGALSQLALEMAAGDAFHWLGIQSSAGVPNSPMTVYFLVLPYWLSDNPLFVTLFIALWNVLGVALLWGLAHRYFGRSVGIVAGLVYAVSPYAISYSRSIWAQDYHTPFIVLAIWLGLLGFVERRRWAQALCLPVLIVGVQIHFAAWTLVPLYVWFVWVGRRQVSWWAGGVSLVLAICALLPFAIGLAQQPSGASDRADTIATIVRQGIPLRWEPIQQMAQLATGLGDNPLLAAYPAWVSDLSSLWILLGGFVLLGAGWIMRPAWRGGAGLVWLWAGLTMVSFVPAWTGSGTFRHYYIPSLPALALLTGLGVVGSIELVRQRSAGAGRWLALALYGVLGLVLVHQAAWTLLSYGPRLEVYTVGEGGRTATPMLYLQAVRDELMRYDDVILLGANPHESNYFIWEPMLYEHTECVRDLLVNGGWVDVLPDGPFAAVVAPLSPINAGFVVPDRYQHSDPIEIALRPGEDPYIIYPFEAAPEWTETPLTYVDVPAYENGVRLLGYYLQDDLMQLMWQLPATPGDTMQYYGHFLDEAGQRIGQRDAPFYFPQYWCAGDRIVTSVAIALPPDVATLRVGLYRVEAAGGTDDYAVVDAAGNVMGHWIDVPLPAGPD